MYIYIYIYTIYGIYIYVWDMVYIYINIYIHTHHMPQSTKPRDKVVYYDQIKTDWIIFVLHNSRIEIFLTLPLSDALYALCKLLSL